MQSFCSWCTCKAISLITMAQKTSSIRLFALLCPLWLQKRTSSAPTCLHRHMGCATALYFALGSHTSHGLYRPIPTIQWLMMQHKQAIVINAAGLCIRWSALASKDLCFLRCHSHAVVVLCTLSCAPLSISESQSRNQTQAQPILTHSKGVCASPK